jgi:septal ring factor EnvC (AmiA/AmiB activator)
VGCNAHAILARVERRLTWPYDVPCRLRDELRAKAREADALEQEVATVNAQVATKDRALKAAQDKMDALNQRALKAEGESASTQVIPRSQCPGGNAGVCRRRPGTRWIISYQHTLKAEG